jgi:heptosyltransferase-2
MPASPSQERILVRGVNWLGDAVMTTPALQRLREAHPAARIALLTPAKLADLWKSHPDIDEVVTFDPGENLWAVARRLRRLRFTTALVLPNSPRSALEVFLAGIPRRIGYARPWRNWLLTERVSPRAAEFPMRKRSPAEIARLTSGAMNPTKPPGAGSHHIHQYLRLAAALGASSEAAPPRLNITPPEVEAVRRRFGFQEHPGARLVGLNAGAEYGPAKRWPLENFVAVAKLLRAREPIHFWILGGAADVEFAEGLAAHLARDNGPESVQCLAGQTTLRELCAVLKACDAVLTNDSGPMHVAAAVGTPVIVPFGSTSAALTGPGWPEPGVAARHQLLTAGAPCSPCFLRVCPIDFRCMTGISASRVAEAVLTALGPE